jgi:hypothetical protein
MPIWVLAFEDFLHMLISFLRARVFFKHYSWRCSFLLIHHLWNAGFGLCLVEQYGTDVECKIKPLLLCWLISFHCEPDGGGLTSTQPWWWWCFASATTKLYILLLSSNPLWFSSSWPSRLGRVYVRLVLTMTIPHVGMPLLHMRL